MIAAVYLSGLLIGVSLILFPSAGTLFQDEEFHGLSSSQYGILFTPQIIMAIVSSSLTATLAARYGMKQALRIGLVFALAAMVVLVVSNAVLDSTNAAFGVLLIATGAIGAGFGFTITALNAYAFDLFPGREDSAVTALHVMTGVGQVGAALILSLFLGLDLWWGAPLVIGLAIVAMIAFQWALPLHLSVEDQPKAEQAKPMRLPLRVWIFALVVFMYGASEGTFGNWTTSFLENDAALSMGEAAAGLSIFWFCVTFGRFLFAVIAARFETRPLYIGAPFVVGLAFLLLPMVDGVAANYVVLALGGFGLSFFFPYSVSIASAENPLQTAAVSGILVASLQLGNGISANVVGFANDNGTSLGTIFQISVIYALVMAVSVIYLHVTRRAAASIPESVAEAMP